MNERLDTLMEEGGIQVCGNAQHCVAVCPKNIPHTKSVGEAGEQRPSGRSSAGLIGNGPHRPRGGR